MTASLPVFGIRRSQRAKRARLIVTDSGEALVVLPARAPERLAAQLVAQHSGWIERHTNRIQAAQLALSRRPALGYGRELRLGGVAHELELRDSRDGILRSRVQVERPADGAARLVVVRSPADTRPVPAVLEGWLRSRARHVITTQVERRSAGMGITPTRLAVRDQRTRWGSASSRGALSFNWRLLLCPPIVLDYVVVHELAHLRVRGHSTAFWALVERHMRRADVVAARRWLREHQAELRRALD